MIRLLFAYEKKVLISDFHPPHPLISGSVDEVQKHKVLLHNDFQTVNPPIKPLIGGSVDE
jgi:hypothetical protein